MSRRSINDEPDQQLDNFTQQIAQILDAITYSSEYRCRTYPWRPPTDIYETDCAVIIKAEVAGIKLEDCNISFEDHVLSIKGIRKDEEAKLNYHCLEIPYGKFQIKILIRGSYDVSNIKISYENGYLYTVLSKAKVNEPNKK